MKIRILNWLLIIDVLTILLILVINFIPSYAARIILGLPFLSFFPGYTLVKALFMNKEIDWIERVGLSVGISIFVVALIGLGLNYTPWGIRLETVLYSIATFIIIMSAVSLIRTARSVKRTELVMELNIGLPGWKSGTFSKLLTALLILSVLCTVGVLVYTVAVPKAGELFTEFYILGFIGDAQDYPNVFTVENGQVARVSYGSGAYNTSGKWGEVTLGIKNYEQKRETYSVAIKIDDEITNIKYEGLIIDQLRLIQLNPGEEWEQKIGFTTQHVGNNQKVEFLLFKGDDATLEDSLHLWINVENVE